MKIKISMCVSVEICYTQTSSGLRIVLFVKPFICQQIILNVILDFMFVVTPLQ